MNEIAEEDERTSQTKAHSLTFVNISNNPAIIEEFTFDPTAAELINSVQKCQFQC